MRTTDPGDAARIELLLAELRLPAIKLVWASLAAQADKEGWPAGRFLAALAEHEIAERSRRRLERHLAEARLPPGKTLDSFDFEAVPVISKAQVMALAAGDAWLNNGANLLLFGPPGGGKSHLAAALGFALVENGWRVLFTRTIDLVQRLQIARRELALEAAIAKLDKFHLLILDDIAYLTKDQAETGQMAGWSQTLDEGAPLHPAAPASPVPSAVLGHVAGLLRRMGCVLRSDRASGSLAPGQQEHDKKPGKPTLPVHRLRRVRTT
jgi:DNA replication protein DnaC